MDRAGAKRVYHPAGRNIRSVWEIATQPYPEAHFATFPEELARRCIAAGCPEQVCRVCGKARERITQPTEEYEALLTKQPHKDEWDLDSFALYLQERRTAVGISSKAVDDALGTNTAYSWWERRNLDRERTGEFRVPTWELYAQLKPLLDMDDRFDESLSRYRMRVAGGWEQRAYDVLAEGNRKDGTRVTTQRRTLGFTDCGHTDYRPGIVLDPFMGSGTVAYVARKLGRHSVGIDLSADYLALAARRLQQQSLFAEPAA